MREEKYFIINESGEVVRVTKAEHEKWMEENKDIQKSESTPTFQTPEQQEERRTLIDNVIEELNQEELTNEDYSKIRQDVKVKTQDDIEKENRERLDDDMKSFQTPQQEGDLDEKETKRQRIKEYLNILDLKEEEMIRLDNEVKTIDKENSEEKSTEEKENGR